MSYEEIKKFIENNKITCRSILEEIDPIMYKNFILFFFCKAAAK